VYLKKALKLLNSFNYLKLTFKMKKSTLKQFQKYALNRTMVSQIKGGRKICMFSGGSTAINCNGGNCSVSADGCIRCSTNGNTLCGDS
jgi:hypothetical protein